MTIGIGGGIIFTDSINFDVIPSNDQDSSMQMSDDVKLTVSTPNEEGTSDKQVDEEFLDSDN